MIKKLFVSVITILLLLSIHTCVFAAMNTNPTIDLNSVNIDVNKSLINGSTHSYVVAATDKQPTIELNSKAITTPAYISEGSVYLPLRAISETLGYKISWAKADHTITLSKANAAIVIDSESYKITNGDHSYYMDGEYLSNPVSGSASLKNTLYMGLDFFSENLALKAKWDKQNKTVILQNFEQNDVTIKTKSQIASTDYLELNLQYPQLDGLANAKVQGSLNAIFEKAALAAKAEGEANAAEMKANKDAGYAGSPNKCGAYFDYSIKYNQSSLLSVVLTDYQYTGGAHGTSNQTSYTFNLDTGKQYTLKDLMKTNADYVSFFNTSIRAQIDAKVKSGVLYEFEDTPFTSIKNDEDYFYLDDDAIMMYFPLYEYFPYAAGIQEFPLEYSSLKDMLNSDFSFLGTDSKLLEVGGVTNLLNVGDTFNVVLKGNATTGYQWQYAIANSDSLKMVSESSVPDSALPGAGSTYTWKFKVLKAGETSLTFKYYRSWEGESSVTSDNIITYRISAK